jgi:anion-transporting  ArsA/GET3 family ATPase
MLDRRFVVIGGKGGVGRTTIAAALASLLAHQGRRVLLAHVRTKQHVHRMLGCNPLTDEMREVLPNLWAVNMNPRAALRERGLMVLRFKAVYKAVMENRLVRYFLRAIPSLDEYSMLGKAWYHTTEVLPDDSPRFDTVVFDGPATGHLITMLRIPRVIVDTVPDGPLTADARAAVDLLSDPARTALWIVTLAEEMAVSEAVDLYHAALSDLQITPDRLVVNALFPDAFERDPEIAQALDGLNGAPGPLDQLVRQAQIIRSRRAINQEQLRHLSRRIPLNQVKIPHLFAPEIDPDSLARIGKLLERSLQEQPPA